MKLIPGKENLSQSAAFVIQQTNTFTFSLLQIRMMNNIFGFIGNNPSQLPYAALSIPLRAL
jgi:hypothetical protein